MHHRVVCIPFADRSIVPGLTLMGSWFAGVSLGLWAACFYGKSVGALALTAGRTVPSFAQGCVVTVLPLCLSAFAVFFFHRTGAYPACLIRGLTIGFLLGALMEVGGPWLGLLLLFSAVMVSPVILWFLWRRLCLGRDGCRRDLIYAFLAALGITAVDCWVVAPFLERALSF